MKIFPALGRAGDALRAYLAGRRQPAGPPTAAKKPADGPGPENYRSYVGPERDYDFMGATQFRLLCALGLRQHHRLLDFGCGSLRAGRLFIPYLDPSNYFGLEPNRWLVDSGIREQIGQSVVDIKRPTFRYEDDFDARHFGVKFNYILAQSIFSHTGPDVLSRTLASFRATLESGAIIAATFIHGDDFDGAGWIYPACVTYSRPTITKLLRENDLFGVELPLFHPRQTWWILATQPRYLPSPSHCGLLDGAVLKSKPYRASVEKALALGNANQT